jgi:hypothetical protein
MTWMTNSPTLSRQVQAKAAEEAAALRLVAVAGSRANDVMGEVIRRRDVFVEDWKRSARSGGRLTALHAALESVTTDITKGWL